MKIKLPNLHRTKFAFAALLMVAAAAASIVAPRQVSAAQVTSRYVKMSKSDGAATAVTYEVGFTTATTATLKGVVVDFCSGSPIPGDTCTKPTGFVAGASSASNTGLTGTWTASATNTTRTLVYSSASASTSVPSGTPITITASGFTNPTADNTTFYARILTYTSDTDATGYTLATTNSTDTGGIAMSTGNDINVSGTVAESLTFCVYGEPISGSGCTGASQAPNLSLGHGSPLRLDASAVDTALAYSQVSTNAGGGVAVRIKNSNACAGLSKDGGTTCQIAPVNAGAATAAAIANGTAAFGLKAASSGGTGTMTVQAPYASANYGMDNTTSDSTVTGTYGSLVASSTGVLDSVNTTYTFAAGAATTTPAGLYTATMSLIATGTY